MATVKEARSDCRRNAIEPVDKNTAAACLVVGGTQIFIRRDAVTIFSSNKTSNRRTRSAENDGDLFTR